MYAPGTNTGHGWIWERPDGMRARCGGPGLCKTCAVDKSDKERSEREGVAANAPHDYAAGIVAGLEMAEKFMALTKSREDLASMIRAAIATAKG